MGCRHPASWSFPTTTCASTSSTTSYRKVMTELGTARVSSRSPQRHPRSMDRRGGRCARLRRRRRQRGRLRRKGPLANRRGARFHDRRTGAAGLRARGTDHSRLKNKGEVAEAGALVSWLCGSGNVGASAKKAAGIKGDSREPRRPGLPPRRARDRESRRIQGFGSSSSTKPRPFSACGPTPGTSR